MSTMTTQGIASEGFRLRWRSAAVAVALASMAASASAVANVALRNGNYNIGYVDARYTGGGEPKIERTYNSKSGFKGSFGWGWGTEFDTFCTVSPDGGVVVTEFGGGATNAFRPLAVKAGAMEAGIEQIVKAAQASGAIGGAAQLANFRKRLGTDSEFRNAEWTRLLRQGTVKAVDVPVGAQLISNKFNYQFLTRVADGFVRSFENGRAEKFDDRCRLSKVSDKNGNFISLAYGKDGKLEKIEDNFNRKLFFTWNRAGLIEKIAGEEKKLATYKYDDLGQLVETRDFDGNLYTYQYSKDRRYNLLQIGYSDKTTYKVEYYGREQNENVKRTVDRDGTITEYVYENGKKGPSHVGIETVMKASDGRVITRSRYDYFVKNRPTGEEWTQKLVTDVDGDITETVYNEQFGLPVSIKRAGQETTFAYDKKGRVLKKATPSETTELAYDARAGKVSKVTRLSRLSKSAKPRWSQFKYDDKANLVEAWNSENKRAYLFYDGFGRIASMADQDKRKLLFKYNENSRPIEIQDPAVGTLTVEYAASGEVKEVKPSKPTDRKVASQVASSFQNLLEIIRPAGVSLSF